MKGLIIGALMIFLTACGFTRPDVVEYQQVIVTPPYADAINIDYRPIDVTRTVVDYY